MKFISYLHDAKAKFGILDNNHITDLTGKISGAENLKDLMGRLNYLIIKKLILNLVNI